MGLLLYFWMDELKKLILRKLIRASVWGGKHILGEFVMNGMPENYRNTKQGKKLIEKTLKELKNDEWIILLSKKTGKGSSEHISLNPRKKEEIYRFLTS